MAKFRTNHSRQGSAGGRDTIVKVGIFGLLVSGLFYIFNLFSKGAFESDIVEPTDTLEVYEEKDYLPSSTTGQVIHHQFYSLSYSEDHEQAEWVAYVLHRDSLEKPWLRRRDQFTEDPQVRTGTATDNDYRNSGYDRGHLVPAADMAYNPEALRETFYFSNISPQSRNFNQGIWRELEELTRDWAKKYEQLYVVTGPVLSQETKGEIGVTRVSVPAAYYKVLLDLTEPELKGVAFLLPNEVSYDPLFEFATTIDKVEEITGIDFFPDLMDDEQEESIESTFNIDLWYFSKSKFQKRLEEWNRANR